MALASFVLASVTGGAALATPARMAAAPSPVTYRGWSGRVPAGWSVIDLAADPTACVRFDLHAVYLGRPGDLQSCPSHVSGRTEALLVEPVEDPTPNVDAQSKTADVHALPATTVSALMARIAIPTAGVTVTATWGTDRATIDRVLSTAAPVPDWRPADATQRTAPSTQPQARASALAEPNSVVGASGPFRGEAFDACTAPSVATMLAWLNSPYRAVGVYIGGSNRSCAQPNLTAGWVTTVTRMGWRLIPIYVGRQAPVPRCRCAPIDPMLATYQGSAAADDAVADALSIGIGPGAALFNDMEEYTGGLTNSPGVVTFLSAWTTRLHALGYRSGVYSGPNSGIRDLMTVTASTSLRTTLPDVVWYARWDGRNQTVGDAGLPADRWPHQRLHQYLNGTSTWGGATINIDRSAVDATLTGSVSTAPPPVPRPALPPVIVPPDLARAFVVRAYAMVLGRRPSTPESDIATWTISYGSSRANFLSALLSTREWATRWTAIEYRTILHRAPDATGGPRWTSWLMGPGQPDVLAAQLAASPERWVRSGANSWTYVRGLYRDVLGRTGSPANVARYANRLHAGGSRLGVALEFTTGGDRVGRFIRSAYKGFLGRAPDAAGAAYWSSVYRRGFDPAAVLVPVGASPEAIKRP